MSAALASMTGFARKDGARAGLRWTWEVRSVNGRGLEVRTRLAPGFDGLEMPVRAALAKRLSRGHCQVTLSATREGSGPALRINEPLLDAVLATLNRLGERIEAAPARLDGILAIRGILETVDTHGETEAADTDAMLASFEAAVDALLAMRAEEGAALGRILLARIQAVEGLVEAAEAAPGRRPEAIRTRLADQIRTLLEAGAGFEPDRLHQEAILLAAKADIREELDRLRAHCAAVRKLLTEGGAIGRRLDFLAQEFNREANTLCAKSNDVGLTTIGLDLKSVIDQFREQIQNVE